MDHPAEQINSPFLKIVSAWAAAGFAKIGIVSWGDFAAFAASMYTCCLIAEWIWKKIIKPVAVRRGWIAYRSNYVGGDDAE